MYTVIKNKGKIVKAYQLGKDNPVVRNLAESGKIRDIGNGRYEIQSQEVINGTFRGEIARIGDWIKIDSQGYPYPNDRKYFEANHMHIEGDTFEQIPKPLQAWDAKLEICQEVIFLVKKRGLVIDESSEHWLRRHYDSFTRLLPPYWYPRKALFVDRFPMTETGKIIRKIPSLID